MALQQSFDLNGLVATTSYRRAEYVGISRQNKTVAVEVSTYSDEAHKGASPIDVRVVTLKNIPKVLNPDGSTLTPADKQYDDYLADAAAGFDPYASAYRAIKKLPDFTGATDV